MKKIVFIMLIALSVNSLFAENKDNDSLTFRSKNEVVVTASRIPVASLVNPFSSSVVFQDLLSTMPRSIASDEALRLVPGIRIDNQANGSRMHMSIRGQGILSERGLRGIKVFLDGIPLNDPSGFTMDLYDIDWATVSRIEVLRGPSASFYGGGGSAGVLNIITDIGSKVGQEREISFDGGSNSFFKGLASIKGSTENVDYRISFSKFLGDGYRNHTGFWGDNFSERMKWDLSDKIKVSQSFIYTDYFNQNAEGLSLDQVKENPLQANPDAVPFNEYQKTKRIVGGINGNIILNSFSDLQLNGFLRVTRYKETSNKAAQYRDYVAPGAGFQYNIRLNKGNFKNTFGVGSDFQTQTIDEVKFKSLSNPARKDDGTDDTNIEDTTLLANQAISQYALGGFAFYNLEYKKFQLNGSLRYDKLHNDLHDKLNTTYNLSDTADFNRYSVKIGGSYSFSESVNLFANWGQGFIPPATEELASNPVSFRGFNKNLVPATSVSQEIGLRGYLGEHLFYDVTAFYMTTDKDFFRYKLTETRGNQEVFYGNTGSSKRLGLETYFTIKPIDDLNIQFAYTYSNFKYSSPDSIDGNFIPNSPEHQLNIDVEYQIVNNLKIGVSSETQSQWYIYTDKIHKDVSQEGFSLFNCRITYDMKLLGTNTQIGLYGKNLADAKWMGFTEPDPDGNCYQPGAGREFFGSLKVRF